MIFDFFASINNNNNKMTQQGQEGRLQQTLKVTLQQCITLARKKIRSKKGITELQALLVDYSTNTQLATIILEVIKLISLYESAKKEEGDEIKDSVPMEQYNSLEMQLQKYEAAVREHIKNQQQLKIYCDDLEEKNKELLKSNEDLLKNTKHIITTLKRDNQRLIEDNQRLRERQKEVANNIKQPISGSNRGEAPSREVLSRENYRQSREQSLISSIKKGRKMIDSQNSQTHTAREDLNDDLLKQKRHSLVSIKTNK